MEGEGAQELFLDGEVLHKLRRQFHEVPPHAGSTQTLETRVGKHTMERVAELMEEGLHLAQCQQGRLFFRGLRKVHHHRDMGAHVLDVTRTEGLLHVLALHPLSLIGGHPCPTLLTLARMEVGIEDCQEGTVLIEHLVSLHIWMVDGDVLVLLEGDAIQAIGQTKHTIDHLGEFEIGTQHLSVDIKLLQLELMGVEAEVPRLQFEVLTLKLASHLFDGSHFFLGCGLIGLDEVVEQFIDIAHITCHAVFQHIVGIGIMPQELGQFTTQVNDPLAYLKVVLRIIMDTLGILGHVQLATKLALGAVGHEGQV